MRTEQPQHSGMQQTMTEDGEGWHQSNAGQHLHIMFTPHRQLLGRRGRRQTALDLVAVKGKREQALRSIFQRGPATITSVEPAWQAAAALGREGRGPRNRAPFFEKR